jgi:hypothetical protein
MILGRPFRYFERNLFLITQEDMRKASQYEVEDLPKRGWAG